MSRKLRQMFRGLRDTTITAVPMGASTNVAYSRLPQSSAGRSSSRSTDEPAPATEVTMKVQTDVKAGGGLLGITAIVIVDINVNLFGGCCNKRC